MWQLYYQYYFRDGTYRTKDSASIAALFITTEAVITDKPEPKSSNPMPQGGGDMDF
jgi:hypothetical protein